MIAPEWALAITTAIVALGVVCNRHVLGWLPDDPPRPGRKLHARPLPLAGVLLLPAFAPWLVATASWWQLGALGIAGVTGFLDDRGKEHGKDLGWRPKAVLLALAAAVAAQALVDARQEPTTWLAMFVFAFLLTNATNFLDNTDGVCAGLAAITLLTAGGPPWLIAAGYTALAFLPWNWPHPRLFLGDAGAYTLGIASALAVGPHLRIEYTALSLVAVQCVDFVQVIAARLWLGLPPWVGDRRHLTHIAQNLGLPRVLVAPVFAALALVAVLVLFH